MRAPPPAPPAMRCLVISALVASARALLFQPLPKDVLDSIRELGDNVTEAEVLELMRVRAQARSDGVRIRAEARPDEAEVLRQSRDAPSGSRKPFVMLPGLTGSTIEAKLDKKTSSARWVTRGGF